MKHSNDHSPISRSKKIWRYVRKAALFIAVFFVVYQVYLYAVPHARVNFKLYKPGNTPVADVQEVLDTPQFSLFGKEFDTVVAPKVTVSYTLPAHGKIRVFESNHPWATSCQEMFAAHCDQTVTPNQQQYLHAVDDRFASPVGYKEQTVEFQRGGTWIRMGLSGTTSYDHVQWDQLIDSFQPASFKNLPVVRSHPGP